MSSFSSISETKCRVSELVGPYGENRSGSDNKQALPDGGSKGTCA